MTEYEKLVVSAVQLLKEGDDKWNDIEKDIVKTAQKRLEIAAPCLSKREQTNLNIIEDMIEKWVDDRVDKIEMKWWREKLNEDNMKSMMKVPKTFRANGQKYLTKWNIPRSHIVFMFRTLRFNPPDKEESDCWLCGESKQDNPYHLLKICTPKQEEDRKKLKELTTELGERIAGNGLVLCGSVLARGGAATVEGVHERIITEERAKRVSVLLTQIYSIRKNARERRLKEKGKEKL